MPQGCRRWSGVGLGLAVLVAVLGARPAGAQEA
jgi:hypothetical protein